MTTPRNRSRLLQRRTTGAIATIALLPVVAGAAAADRFAPRPAPAHLDALRLDQPVQRDSELRRTDERADYLVRLVAPAIARGNNLAAVEADQRAFESRVLNKRPGLRVTAKLRVVLNGFLVQATEADARALAADPAVLRVTRVTDYETHLEETVPYIGASAVQALGFDGTGVKVAVLDSGIDYTHEALSGPGTQEAYEAAWGTDFDDPLNTTTDGLFPTAKVVDGFDFVGEAWVGGAGSPPLAPDPDPISAPDLISPGGHGHHVADIIGGTLGVAPGVDLYAVKVCAAQSSACSGVALLQGMEFSLDPNGDGDPSDRVDVINMSLGANYGQPFDDDLSAAVDNATELGVLTVASAGNSGDEPYVTGTPAAAPTALSVAQTAVPSASAQLMAIDGVGDAIAIFQSWSEPLDGVISGPVQYGDGEGGALNGCSTDPDDVLNTNPFPPGSLDGKIVLVDRGTCFFSEKIFNIGAAGGALGIIGLVAPGAPFNGGFGGNTPEPDIPGFMIDQADADLLRGNDASVVFDPDNVLSLAMSLVSSSSRGPANQGNRIKPEIGAPGASVSAASGTGTDANAFGGTSGAAPMVAGSAALLLDAFPGLTPLQTKQLLINGAETEILNELGNPLQGLVAPITRIGGGEVRVDQSYALPSIAYDADDPAGGGLSFGLVSVGRPQANRLRTLAVENLGSTTETYRITPRFRFQDDVDAGRATVLAPQRVTVGPGQVATVDVLLTINGENLPENEMNSGPNGINPVPLNTQELDGYLELTGDDHTLTVPWHALAYRSSFVIPETRTLAFDDSFTTEIMLQNIGVGTATTDVFSLLALSENQPSGDRGEQSPTPDLAAVGVASFDGCDAGFLWVFGATLWEPVSHLIPVSVAVAFDVDRDGTDDFEAFTADFGDGRQVVVVEDLINGGESIFFFAEHVMNSRNVALPVCGEQLGLSAADIGQTPVDVTFRARDFYFGGPGDEISGITITPFGERFVASAGTIPGQTQGMLNATDLGRLPGPNTLEPGLLMFTDGPSAAVQPLDAIVFLLETE